MGINCKNKAAIKKCQLFIRTALLCLEAWCFLGNGFYAVCRNNIAIMRTLS